MLSNHNAGERTLGEFVQLLSRTGWKVVEVHAAHQSWMPQIVAVPVAIPPMAIPSATATTSAPEPEPQTAAKVNGTKGVAADAPPNITAPATDSPAFAEESEKEKKKNRRRSFWKTLVFAN